MSKERKKISKTRKIINWVITGIFGVLLVMVLGVQISALATKGDNFGVPNYFGTQIMLVLTDSMEPDYMVDETIIVKKVDPSEITIGDDVSFFYDQWQRVVTHRVIEIETPEQRNDGHYNFVVHGINKESTQCEGDCTNKTQEFSEEYLLGKVVGKSAFLGGLFNFMTSWYGLLTLLLIPTLYLIISSGIDIFKALKDDDDDNSGGSGTKKSKLSDADRERLKQDLLQEMLDKKKGEAK